MVGGGHTRKAPPFSIGRKVGNEGQYMIIIKDIISPDGRNNVLYKMSNRLAAMAYHKVLVKGTGSITSQAALLEGDGPPELSA